MVALKELLPLDAIRLDVSVPNWAKAVRASGDLLVSTGTATDGYTAEMIANVAENGPYIVLAPGFAFAHARPSPAVLRTGMSWVRLAEPVEFGHEANDPVTLVVALAATDAGSHTDAMATLARLLADPETSRALAEARTSEDVWTLVTGAELSEARTGAPAAAAPEAPEAPAAPAAPAPDATTGAPARSGGADRHTILTVCGNGLGTSLFLKNTLEQVLERWGWSSFVTVEATDTISAKGKASEAAAILTSGEIARTLGDVGTPVRVVENFTDTGEVDRVLRETYEV
ncbi:PTS sugar transporter subunit IIA [Streptomyces spiramenti]|uniref:Ascorbate-specific PTS system EIIA component n=1 Tax=Streptomyces spiramenti TaxID=2720606 RepID=A0ABX1APC7_9ACTN|nr:PTS sugar transporter subunit IIA [Streptomyces spiramenti]NJP68155.1 PTS transporter subunit EIIA [Streptomyces spiramenti]